MPKDKVVGIPKIPKKEKTVEEKLYDLRLHDQLDNERLTIMRVPGGWIYIFPYEANGSVAIETTFVPFNQEFKK